jgi:transcriptional regulator with PAS, ATPase and Fis domain
MLVIQHETEERQWLAELTSRLRVLGEMMASTIQRAEASEALRVREEALKTSERRLTLAAAAGRCGLWEFDTVANRLWMTPERRDLYGLSEGTYATQEQWLQAVHPDDRGPLVAQLNDLKSLSAEFSADYRVMAADGRVRCMRASGHRGADGRLLGVSVDITEQREREEALRQAHEELHRLRDRLEEENVYLRKAVAHAAGDDLITGRSPAILRAVDLAAQVAPTTSTVLLVGETGTGKERFAEFIHRASPRGGRHMVRVNCSAIPTALIESELFGRERGAYTGALSKQVGRFELAQGSTLFLDEIGDLPMEVQVKLLRVLQERSIERLGNSTPIAVDVRIIAATHRDLEAAVRAGTFRADLYYRLNVFPIEMPPLRERREDIPRLVEVFVDELGGTIRKRFDSVERASLDGLQRYDWPGNVRELRNAIERAMILATGPTLRIVAPQPVLGAVEPSGLPGTPGLKLKDLEREHILRVLEQAGWRVRGSGAAAEVLGLKPTSLEGRMARLGIRRPTRGPE